MMPITSQFELLHVHDSPWRKVWPRAAEDEIPYHLVLSGQAIFEQPQKGASTVLASGDMVLLPHGAEHILHGAGPLSILHGRLLIGAPHGRLIRDYLPPTLLAQASDQLASVAALIRMESNNAGGYAIVQALTPALLALALRTACESRQAAKGLLALAAAPRLGPAIAAMLEAPERSWKLADLAELCNMSRATLHRHFQDKLGRSALDMLADIRMSLAANALKKPRMTTAAAAGSVGYRSAAAFRRVFTNKIGVPPEQWRSLHAHQGYQFL